jgi:hypothetical protein
MIIGHGRKGIQRVYDQHSYEDEMREALELGRSLADIVTPPLENIVRLKRRGHKQEIIQAQSGLHDKRLMNVIMARN